MRRRRGGSAGGPGDNTLPAACSRTRRCRCCRGRASPPRRAGPVRRTSGSARCRAAGRGRRARCRRSGWRRPVSGRGPPRSSPGNRRSSRGSCRGSNRCTPPTVTGHTPLPTGTPLAYPASDWGAAGWDIRRQNRSGSSRCCRCRPGRIRLHGPCRTPRKRSSCSVPARSG